MKEQLEFYFSLGKTMYKFYDGQTLTDDELILIASSSNEDKLMALKLNATERLRMRTDRSLENFNKNSKSLEIINSTSKKI